VPLKRIEALLLTKIGLDAESLGPGAIAMAVRARMHALHLEDQSKYAERALLSPDEQQALIEEVVVSESWFFREPAAYELMKERFLPLAQQGTQVRVLCLPCATGEEPYSVVMTLLHAGVSPLKLEVHGVDVSERALRHARAARYSQIAFRAKAEQYNRYFEPDGTGFLLSPSIRRMVHFKLGNILDPKLYPAQTFHAVFCRNLLIYLDAPSRAAAVSNLGRMLRPEGLLFVGHSEASIPIGLGFTRTGDPKSFAFAAAAVAATPGTAAAKTRHTTSPRPSLAVRLQVRPRTSVEGPGAPRPSGNLMRSLIPRRSLRPSLRRSIPPNPGKLGVQSLEDARAMADRGDLKGAARRCEEALRHLPKNPEVHSLMGVVLRALGDIAGARNSFEQALRFENDHYESLIHLALLAESEGDASAARTYRARAALAREG
jgi:chemotaxis protein methyltransferase WspC